MEYSNYFGSIIINDVWRTREIKRRIAMAKAAINNNKAIFTNKLNLNLRKKLVKLLHLELSVARYWNWDSSESRSEIPGKLWHTRGVHVLRYPNLFKKNYSPQEAENAVISQRNHPVDIHIFSQRSRHDCVAAANASLGDLRTWTHHVLVYGKLI